MKTETIIGKDYLCLDNSWQYNLSDERIGRHSSIGGSSFDEAKLAVIKSDPFTVNIKFLNETTPHQFILVDHDGDTVFILYFPHRIVTENNTVEEMLRFDACFRETF